MSDFIEIIGHAKKLSSALKDLAIDDIEALINKLEKILDSRKNIEAEQIAIAAEKAKTIELLQQMMLESNISPEELVAKSDKAPNKKRKARVAKYAIIINGVQITWSGQGRMPNAFKNATAPIESFLIKK